MSDLERATSFPIPSSESIPKKTCHLCGLPVGRSKITQKAKGETVPFCCPGCRQVFGILFHHPEGLTQNFRDTDLYRACLESGIIPRDEQDLASRERQEGEKEPQATLQGLSDKDLAIDLTLKIEGMWCPACSWLIEEVLRTTKGIFDPQVSFLNDLVQVKYLPHVISPQEILAKISPLGYRPTIFQDRSSGEEASLYPLGISAILTANIMMVSFALYFGFFQDFSPEVIGYLSYPLWAMATPVVFYGGFSILQRAFTGLRYKSTSMETLIAIGALAAYSYSLVQMARGSLHLYFDTASMLITLTLLGKFIEARSRAKVNQEITGLYRLANPKVRLLKDGQEKWVLAEAVQFEDEFLVLPGERVPLDGRVLSGEGSINESILTGEPKPVRKQRGDEVMGGAMLLQGELNLQVTRLGKESMVGQLVSLMQKALREKNPFEMFADRMTRWFVPALLVLAVTTGLFLFLYHFPAEEIFLRSITVLVIACPCALGIAVPLVKVTTVGLGLRKGILIRDPGALERVKSLDTLIFDKTGTLTQGNFSLQETVTETVAKQEALARIASVEIHSDHFLATEVVRKAEESSLSLTEIQQFEELKGMGVKGLFQGQEVFIGNRQLLGRHHVNLPTSWEQKASSLESIGMTVVFFAWAGLAQGFLVFGDSLKKGVKEMVGQLQGKGLDAWLISGDAQETTRAVAEELGIYQYRGQALPHDKVEFIRALQKGGHRVGMVGDGINDASALAQADVGFALGTGADLARQASDLTLMGGDPTRVLDVLELSRLTHKGIRQNLFLAFFYNGLAIPLAISGLLNPLIAVLAMFASSLMVIGNTLRISRAKMAPGLF